MTSSNPAPTWRKCDRCTPQKPEKAGHSSRNATLENTTDRNHCPRRDRGAALDERVLKSTGRQDRYSTARRISSAAVVPILRPLFREPKGQCRPLTPVFAGTKTRKRLRRPSLGRGRAPLCASPGGDRQQPWRGLPGRSPLQNRRLPPGLGTT